MEYQGPETRPQFILSSKKSFGGMESEPMLTPREKSPLPENFSTEGDGTHNAESVRTASPTHYQRAIPTPNATVQDRQTDRHLD